MSKMGRLPGPILKHWTVLLLSNEVLNHEQDPFFSPIVDLGLFYWPKHVWFSTQWVLIMKEASTYFGGS